jgi:uncharacterized membrane protein
MAATKSQGASYTLFMVGLTAAAAGTAGFTTSTGKLALLLGLVAVAVSFWKFLKIKPLEGKTAVGAQPAVLKLVGSAVVLLGWLIVFGGINAITSVGGRLIVSIAGLVVSIAGIIFILAPAVSKNAIWKA